MRKPSTNLFKMAQGRLDRAYRDAVRNLTGDKQWWQPPCIGSLVTFADHSNVFCVHGKRFDDLGDAMLEAYFDLVCGHK
jgi:hypothetical protein